MNSLDLLADQRASEGDGRSNPKRRERRPNKLRTTFRPDTDALLQRVDARLDALDISDRKASVAATGKVDTIRNLRRGLNPGFDKLKRLAPVLGVSVEWLLTGEDVGAPLVTATTAAPPLRLCGYCKTWNDRPCGNQCCLQVTDPTWEEALRALSRQEDK